MFLVFFLKLKTLPPQIPLFYSQVWGEDQLGKIWMIFIIPFLMILFVFINNFLKNKYFKNQLVFITIFYYTNLLIIISFTLIFLKIIFLVS